MNTGDTPVRIAYCQGISNFMNWYDLEYPVIFIVAAFALACTYAKDSLSGINELTLSAAKGRKKDFRARWIAGNLFTASVYIIFIGVLLIEHGAVATFGGFGASAQTYWFHCILNINIGTGIKEQYFFKALYTVLSSKNSLPSSPKYNVMVVPLCVLVPFSIS